MTVDNSRQGSWVAMTAQNRPILTSEEPELPLYGGGGGAGPMEPSVSMKDYVDARDEATESRLASQLDKLPTKSTIWAAAGTIVGLLLAVAAFAGDRFDGGMSVSPTLAKIQTDQQKRDENQDAQAKLIDQKLDLLIKQTATK